MGSPGTSEAALEISDLAKRYGDTVALDGVSFAVAPAQMYGFVGPNGAGKTTAMRIVLGVLTPDAGEVRWRGQPIDEQARRAIGYMPEERGLYPKMRVAEQLAYLAQLHGVGEQDAEASAHRWIERLGIADRADDAVEELSLGNQQRVQLAAALVHEPDLLVLDEPFSGLDPVGVDLLSEVLVEEIRARGVPVIFSSHQLDLVERLCDAVAIIAGGRLVAAGEVAELRVRGDRGRWRLELEGADQGWYRGLEGIRHVQDATFELDRGTDPGALLEAGRRAGAVRRFGPVEPTLAELFREVTVER